MLCGRVSHWTAPYQELFSAWPQPARGAESAGRGEVVLKSEASTVMNRCCVKREMECLDGAPLARRPAPCLRSDTGKDRGFGLWDGMV